MSKKTNLTVVKEESIKAETQSDNVIEQDRKLVQEFTSNPENKKKAQEAAFQIREVLPNWFSVKQVTKKFKVGIPEAAARIEMLVLMGICASKVEKGVPFFKIDLDYRAQRQIISDLIIQKEGEILYLKEKLAKLN